MNRHFEGQIGTIDYVKSIKSLIINKGEKLTTLKNPYAYLPYKMYNYLFLYFHFEVCYEYLKIYNDFRV